MNMEYSREKHLKSPDAPRRRVYHPRKPKFAVILVALAVCGLCSAPARRAETEAARITYQDDGSGSEQPAQVV